jgi:hypothetical protein
MNHGSARLNKSRLANVVTLLLVGHREFDDAHQVFIGAAGAHYGVQVVFAQGE